jgi:hypothetical protein
MIAKSHKYNLERRNCDTDGITDGQEITNGTIH